MSGDAVFRCRDEAVIPAPPTACFAVLADLTTWPRWWTLVTIAPARVAEGVATLGPAS